MRRSGNVPRLLVLAACGAMLAAGCVRQALPRSPGDPSRKLTATSYFESGTELFAGLAYRFGLAGDSKGFSELGSLADAGGGLEAIVDGELKCEQGSASIFRCHEVDLVFRSRSLVLGASISATALACVLALLLLRVRRAWRERSLSPPA